ncbi:hypothetical protein ACTJIJ_15750 [Niabella sp. 22666]|uniref:hypothetical protein n=1 Tax=Niabella sp. 22666 TaxID=3453954 RepID=UPI003F8667A2
MKLLSIILMTVCGVSFFSCDSELKGSHSYTIYNNSEHEIGVYSGFGGTNGTEYPDTSLPKDSNYVWRLGIGGMRGYSSRGSWEYIFNKLPKDTLSIFILHGDTLKKYSWSEIMKGYKILKRYDLSYQDLKEANFAIYYP